jgi:hypothetical protein
MVGSMGGESECEGLRRKLILVLLLVDDRDMEGEGGGSALRRFGEV